MVTDRYRFESQGVELDAQLVLPDAGTAPAAVVCVTGGGTAGYEAAYSEWQEFLAEEAGLASLAFNARGVGTSDGSFRTDSPNFDPTHSKANSQASRTLDTITAYRSLKSLLDITDDQQMAIIGSSMGGDIALHALDQLEPGALVLKAPAAYPDQVHNVPYGPTWGAKIQQLGGDSAALTSPNFNHLRKLKIPKLLIFSGGEDVIPDIVQDRYMSAVWDTGGEAVMVGDQTTRHTYMGARLNPEQDTAMNEQARQATYAATAKFLKQTLLNS